MLEIRLNDRNPKVVALQILVNAFTESSLIDVDGIFGSNTEDGVEEVQRRARLPATGLVDGATWAALTRGRHLSVISANDIYDPRHDEVCPPGLRGPSLISTSGMSGGVGQVTGDIAHRATVLGPMVLLRFYGHGAPGLMGVTGGTGTLRDMDGQTIRDPLNRPVRPDHVLAQTTISNESFSRIRAHLLPLRPLFAPFGSVELHGCRVGRGREGRRLLTALAQTLGVPASAGRGPQSFGLNTSYRFEGPVNTVYPGGITLRDWARQASDRALAA